MTDSDDSSSRRRRPAPSPWSARSRRSARTWSSASRAARSCRRTTRCSTPPRSGTCWSGTSRAPATPPRATRRRPAGSASAWRPPARARPTWSPRSPTRTWTRCRSSRSPARCRPPAIGTDAFQEADICGITLPITKHNFLVKDAGGHPADDRRGVPHRADRPARPGAGRPAEGRAAGDHHLQLAAGAGPARLPAGAQAARQADPGGRPADRRGPPARCSTSAAACSRRTRRPSCAILAELTGIPVVTTLMARGAFPDSHRQHLGMPGMHGTVAAVSALQKADLLVALGARFDDRVTGKLSTFAPHALVVHADIDPAEISKNRTADVPIVGDCREVITAAGRGGRGRVRRRPPGRPHRLVGADRLLAGDLPARLRGADRRLARPAVRHRAARRDRRPGRALRGRRRPAPDVGRAVHLSTRSRTPGSTPAASARWATRCRRRWAPRWAGRRRPCGRSTATAASR